MIYITKSPIADTRTCDFANVSSVQLLRASEQHIRDVEQALYYFSTCLETAAYVHDRDKITDIKQFHADFITGFEQTTWWDNHRKISRHHLAQADGVPANVNLIDVLEYISDCVMAGMARSGEVTPLDMTPELMQAAFTNTVELLKKQVVVA